MFLNVAGINFVQWNSRKFKNYKSLVGKKLSLPVPRFRLLLEILSTLICCLIVFHQAEISIVWRRIQGGYNVTRARVEVKTSRLWSLWKQCLKPLGYTADMIVILWRKCLGLDDARWSFCSSSFVAVFCTLHDCVWFCCSGWRHSKIVMMSSNPTMNEKWKN